MERLAVLRWMELLHPRLPQLVARTFAYDLQRMTLKDIQPQIVDALDGFLAELKNEEVTSARIDARTRRFQPQRNQIPQGQYQRDPPRRPRPSFSNSKQSGSSRPFCKVCRAHGRAFDHNLVDCDHTTPYDKRKLLASRSCNVTEYDDDDCSAEEFCDDMDNLALDATE